MSYISKEQSVTCKKEDDKKGIPTVAYTAVRFCHASGNSFSQLFKKIVKSHAASSRRIHTRRLNRNFASQLTHAPIKTVTSIVGTGGRYAKKGGSLCF